MLASNLFCRQRAFRCFLLVCGNPKLAKRFRIRRGKQCRNGREIRPRLPRASVLRLLASSWQYRTSPGAWFLPKFHRSPQKHRRPQCRPFFTSKFFQDILGLSVRSSTEIEAPGRAPAAFDNPPKPILRFLPQIGEWMFMALVAVKLEKAEIWHG